ncbi:unnamed protein product [Arabis nemorensis]|uniref:proline--tRNA ligase n=1 Tax=Arabis nemorensis TaxID=586526 RepID=A0A565C7Z4_9BRAS|nr:unnamed protein product [Arabis nemorensis]
MIHGDDKGLVLPPKVALIQAVVIPVTRTHSEACAAVTSALEATNNRSEGGLKRLLEAAHSLLRSLEAAGIHSEVDLKRLSQALAAADAGLEFADIHSEVDPKRLYEACAAAALALQAVDIRTEVDQLGDIPVSGKIAHWMRKGVPLIVLVNGAELDPVGVVRRNDKKKKVFPKSDLARGARLLLDSMHDDMLRFARKKRDECVKEVHTWEDFEFALNNRKLVLAPWCDEADVAKEIKDRTYGAAKIFCTPFDQPELPLGTPCFASGKLARTWSYWSR